MFLFIATSFLVFVAKHTSTAPVLRPIPHNRRKARHAEPRKGKPRSRGNVEFSAALLIDAASLTFGYARGSDFRFPLWASVVQRIRWAN